MAISKTINFLPEYFQTLPNQRFLSSTLDQLVSSPQIDRFAGYIGQRYNNGQLWPGAYLQESTAQRANYQLEPNFVTHDQGQNINGVVGFNDVLAAASNKGALAAAWNRLLTGNLYTWRGFVDLDKLISYQNYSWVPKNGLPTQPSYAWFWNNPLVINNSNINTEQSFTISRSGNALYVDSNNNPNPQLVLERGGRYTFNIVNDSAAVEQRVEKQLNQRGTVSVSVDNDHLNFNNTSGQFIANSWLSSPYNVDFDLDNNPWTVESFVNPSTITPQSMIVGCWDESNLANSSWRLKTTFTVGQEILVFEWVDASTGRVYTLASPAGLVLNQWSHVAVSYANNILTLYINGASVASTSTFTSALMSDSSLSIGADILGNSQFLGNLSNLRITKGTARYFGPQYVAPTTILTNDQYTVLLVTFSATTSQNQFFDSATASQSGMWIQAAPGIAGTSLVNPTTSVRLTPSLGVINNGVTSGVILFQIPKQYNTGNQYEFDLLFNGNDKTLYIQDDSVLDRVIELVIVDPITAAQPVNFDVTTILGQLSYISGNGIELINGLHITFDNTAYPAPYNNPTKSWIVDGVGTGITLVPVDQLIVPTALILQGNPPDYITINRASLDLNPWSRSNQWIPLATIQFTANYLIEQNIVTADQIVIPPIASRPIIEFFAGLTLFGVGKYALPAVTLYDTVTLDGFENVQGAAAYIIDGQQVNQNDLVIFNADTHASVRQNIYQINFIDPTTTTAVNRLSPVRVMSTGNIVLSGVQTIDNIKLAIGDRVLVNNPLDQLNNGIYVVSYGNWTISSDFYNNAAFGVYVEQGQTYNSTYFTTTGESGGNINFIQSTAPVIQLIQYSAAAQDSCTTVASGTTYLNIAIVWDTTTLSWQVAAQNKTGVQQSPKFDLINSAGQSFSNLVVYPETTFVGSTLFSYAINDKNQLDSVLNLPVVYGSIGNLGDLTFNNAYETDAFTYQLATSTVVTTTNINTGDVVFVNPVTGVVSSYDPWLYINSMLELYQNFEVTGSSSVQLEGKLLEKTKINSQPTQVFVDGQQLQLTEFIVSQISTNNNNIINITILAPVLSTSNVLIKVLASTPIPGAYYDVPPTFKNNPFGQTLSTFTITQLQNHVESTVATTTEVNVNYNLNQVIFNNKLGSLVIHEAISLLPTLLLANDIYNIDQAIKTAADDYTLFKQKFLNVASQINNITNLPSNVGINSIFAVLTAAQRADGAWYASDMVPIGGISTVYNIVNNGQVKFTIKMAHNTTSANNVGLVAYLTDNSGIIRQLVIGIDYTLSSTAPTVTILTPLVPGQILTFYEMANTDGCYVPSTPAKLGLAPAYVPQIFVDDTNVTPTTVIRGHDGSLTTAYGDFRDALLLDLELRIYNNIKVNSQLWTDVIETNVPTINRFKSEMQLTNNEVGAYTFIEQNQILSKMFYEWVTKYQVNYTASVYNQNDPFTWNWSSNVDKFNNLPLSVLPGGWRGIYNYFYNTIRPHLTPWESLNIAVKPPWWDNVYGPAPYTGTNLNLWQDLQNGIIRDPAGIRYSSYGPRTFTAGKLLQVIPVNSSGNLLDPSQCITSTVNSSYLSGNYVFGDGGPAETAWRASSYYPFAKLRLQILQNPLFMCGQLWDLDNYAPINGFSQFRYQSILPAAISQVQLHQVDTFNGVLVRKHSILNYTLEYLRKFGRTPTLLRESINSTTVNLVHGMAGFANVNDISVYVDQSTATIGSAIQVLPTQDYTLYLSENTPIGQLVYSGVIVSKTALGYTVSGYDLTTPFFTILPELPTSPTVPLGVGNNTFLIYTNYSTEPQTVAYNTVFSSVQTVINFIIAYGRYLESVGLVFTEDPALDKITWQNAAVQFIQWTYENWAVSNSGQSLSLVLNPGTSNLTYTSTIGTLQNLLDTENNSIIDVNQNQIEQKYLDVLRDGNSVNIKTLNQAIIAGLHVNIVTFEHKLVINNTTVFGDTIYDPISGIRQIRLRIAGQKTANWNGSLDMPGFMLTTSSVSSWQPMTDYPSGSIILFKNVNYMALTDVIGATSFQFNQFTKISNIFTDAIIPNLNLKGLDLSNAYNTEYRNYITDFVRLRGSMIGYVGNDWLNNLNIDLASQIDFYRGWIKEKGSLNSVQAYGRAQNLDLNTLANINEEYAIRLGEYGITNNTGFADVQLPSAVGTPTVVNPLVVTYTNQIDSTDTRTFQVTPRNLFNKSDNFTTTFIQPQGTLKTSSTEFQAAGPVLPRDILNTANVRVGSLSVTDYSSLYFNDISDLYNSDAAVQTSILKIGLAGGIFWIANDPSIIQNNNWNVIRFVPTTAEVLAVQQIDAQTISLSITKDINAANNTPILINISDTTSNIVVQGSFLVSNYVVAPTSTSVATLYITTAPNQFNVGTTTLTISASQLLPLNYDIALPVGTIYTSKSLRFDSIGTANTSIIPNNFNLPAETNVFVDHDQTGWASYVYYEPFTASNEPVAVSGGNISQAIGYDTNNSILWIGKPQSMSGSGEIILKPVYNYVTSSGNILPTIDIEAASINASRSDSDNLGYNVKSLNNLSVASSANTAVTGLGQVYVSAWNSIETPSRIRTQQILSIDGFNSPGSISLSATYANAAIDTSVGGAVWSGVNNVVGVPIGNFATVTLTTPQYQYYSATNAVVYGTGGEWSNISSVGSSSGSYASVQIAQLINTFDILSISPSGNSNASIQLPINNLVSVTDSLYITGTNTVLDGNVVTVVEKNFGNIVVFLPSSNIALTAGASGVVVDLSITNSQVSQNLTANILTLVDALPNNAVVTGISFNFLAYYTGSTVQPTLTTNLNIGSTTDFLLSLTPQEYSIGNASALYGNSSASLSSLITQSSNIVVDFQAVTSDTSSNITTVFVNGLSAYVYYTILNSSVVNTFNGASIGNGVVWGNLSSINNVSAYSSATFVIPKNNFIVTSANVTQTVIETY